MFVYVYGYCCFFVVVVDGFDFLYFVGLGQQVLVVFEQFVVEVGVQVVVQYWNVQLVDYFVELLDLGVGQELCFVYQYVVYWVVGCQILFYLVLQVGIVVEGYVVSVQVDL